ncbi:MAG: hypothetical protein WAR83_16185 [Flavobacteriales bacterium]
MITKNTIICYVSILSFSAASAQSPVELVPNGSFEQLEKPVKTFDQLPNAEGWSNATLGLCDVFVPDAQAKTVGVPENDYGSIKSVDGANYAGFFAWKDDVRRNFDANDPDDVFVPGWNEYSEYLQCQLNQPLKENVTYEVVFHVALAGNSDRSIMGIGAHFCVERMDHQHRKFVEVVPQVYMEEIIKEKGAWKEIRGEFVADGGESFLVIGTYPYVGGESVNLIEGYDNRYAFFYLDAISVREKVGTE